MNVKFLKLILAWKISIRVKKPEYTIIKYTVFLVSVIKASSLAVLVFDVPAAVPFTGIELYKQFVAANLGTLISQRLLENEDKIRLE